MTPNALRHLRTAHHMAGPSTAVTVRSHVRRLLVILLTLLVVMSPTAAAHAITVQQPAMVESAAANTVLEQFDQQLLGLLNGARAGAGASPLTAAPGLRSLALRWSDSMASGATGGVLQHNPDYQAQLSSYGAASATAWAENVASWSPAGSYSAQAIFNGYMASPGHRANILNPSYRYVGVASVANSAGGAFNTQDFTNSVDAAVHQAPIGSFDAATPYGDTVTVAGWSLEPSNTSATTQVHVYINATGYALNTTTMRTDVNNAYGATGTHGFKATLPLPPGTNNICAYAVSTIGNGNTLISCRTVTRTVTRAAPPIGYFDAATPYGDTVTVAGWSLEPSNTSATTQVHVYINATGYALNTTTMRTDVNNAYGATGTHGFKATLPLPAGTNNICAYAVSTIGNGNTLISCRTVTRTVTRTAPPIGYFDAATPYGDTVTVAGWSLEPSNTSATTQVHVYINATGYALNTTTMRTDVNNAYGATGTHGFKATLPLPAGTNNICAYAVSTIGNGNTLISCRTVQRGGFPDATNTGVPSGTVP